MRDAVEALNANDIPNGKFLMIYQFFRFISTIQTCFLPSTDEASGSLAVTVGGVVGLLIENMLEDWELENKYNPAIVSRYHT
jgi:hypothetical protein